MAKFEVLRGKHTGKDGAGTVRRWVKGETIESDKDLEKMFNQPPSALKFKRLADDARADVGEVIVTARSPGPAPAPLPPLAPTPVSVKPVQGTPSPVSMVQPASAPKAAPQASGPDTLDTMSIAELKKVAEEEEIDLKGATRKEDMLKAIRAAYGA